MLELELVKKEYRDVVSKAEKFFDILHRGHSHFQIKHFILGDDDCPLPDDKFHHAMMETYGRYEGLIQLHYEHRKLENEIVLLELDIAEMDGKLLSNERRAILVTMAQDEITLKRLQMKNIERSIKDTCREMNSFMICMEEVKPLMKYKDYEAKEREHWLRMYAIQKIKNKTTCGIPKKMLMEDVSKKIIDEQVKLLAGGEHNG